MNYEKQRQLIAATLRDLDQAREAQRTGQAFCGIPAEHLEMPIRFLEMDLQRFLAQEADGTPEH